MVSGPVQARGELFARFELLAPTAGDGAHLFTHFRQCASGFPPGGRIGGSNRTRLEKPFHCSSCSSATSAEREWKTPVTGRSSKFRPMALRITSQSRTKVGIFCALGGPGGFQPWLRRSKRNRSNLVLKEGPVGKVGVYRQAATVAEEHPGAVRIAMPTNIYESEPSSMETSSTDCASGSSQVPFMDSVRLQT